MTEPWQSIATVPSNNPWNMPWAWVRFEGGAEIISDLRDGSPGWWETQGATHWKPATATELREFFTDYEA